MKKAGEDASQDEECDWLMDVGNTRRGAGIFFFFFVGRRRETVMSFVLEIPKFEERWDDQQDM